MIRPIRLFWVLAALMGLCCNDGRTQPLQPPVALHMSAGPGFTDATGVVWTPNGCSGWVAFPNPGAFLNPIYNTPAYTQTAGVPIICALTVPNGVYALNIHLIEAVRSFNAPQKRVFNITVNGQPLITNIDVFQRAGGVEIPYDVVSVVGTRAGQITISFTQVKSSAMFAGIELVQVAPNYGVVDYETPSGPVDGVNAQFTLARTPNPPSSLHVFINGLMQAQSAFIVSGQTVIFTTPPPTGAAVIATYWYNDNAPIIMAQRWKCEGSGTNPNGPGWDCAGLWLIKLMLGDGTVRGPYVGIAASPEIAGNGGWVPVPINVPNAVVTQ